MRTKTLRNLMQLLPLVIVLACLDCMTFQLLAAVEGSNPGRGTGQGPPRNRHNWPWRGRPNPSFSPAPRPGIPPPPPQSRGYPQQQSNQGLSLFQVLAALLGVGILGWMFRRHGRRNMQTPRTHLVATPDLGQQTLKFLRTSTTGAVRVTKGRDR